jgi:hypothetical protein
VALDEAGVHYPDGARLNWHDARTIAEAESSCYVLEGETIRKIHVFSETTRRSCGLMATPGAPTLLVAGFPMHRFKGIDPLEDTRLKIRAANPIGTLLDTAMGLGYTAIAAARTAARVVTLEVDPAVVEVASYNPYSRDLFTLPNIERVLTDSIDYIADADDESFTRILHDPPTVALAGELYSGVYYRELYRILQRGGRLFHYIGDLSSNLGRRTTPGVIERLEKAGFTRVIKRPEAYGVVAFK